MENCDSPVRFTVGGAQWYYQTFYGEDLNVSAVRLYDGGGDFVKEFRSLDKLMDWVKRSTKRHKEKALKDAAKSVAEYDRNNQRFLNNKAITPEEKAETQRVFMQRFAELMGKDGIPAFAEKLGLTVSSVQYYLNGGRFPTAHAVKRIAIRCGVTTDWLLGKEPGIDEYQ